MIAPFAGYTGESAGDQSLAFKLREGQIGIKLTKLPQSRRGQSREAGGWEVERGGTLQT